MWYQNLISVSSGAKVAGDMHQLSFSGVGYGTTHHHTSSEDWATVKITTSKKSKKAYYNMMRYPSSI
jgi:hypothetical protein